MLNLCLKDLHIILILIYHASKHFGDMLLCCRTSFERIIQQKNWTWIVATPLVWSLFFTYRKIEQSTLLEGLCVPGGSGRLIFRYVRDKVWIGTKWPQVGLSFWCSFFLLKSSFKWSVCYGVVPTTNLHTTSRERDRSVICICTLVTVPTVSLYKSLMKEKFDIRIIRLTF